MTAHIVAQGESLKTIAHSYGFLWETLWLHEANAALRSRRENPEVLVPGDRVEIPRLERKGIAGNADARHIFRRRGTRGLLRLRLETGGKVCPHLPFEISIGSVTLNGETDASGMLEIGIPPNAEHGVLVTHGPEGMVVRRLRLGHLDPADSIGGALSRLINLGIAQQGDRAVQGERFNNLVTAFQAIERLPLTGKLDESTAASLMKCHGS